MFGTSDMQPSALAAQKAAFMKSIFAFSTLNEMLLRLHLLLATHSIS
jgi:hypothetical protein